MTRRTTRASRLHAAVRLLGLFFALLAISASVACSDATPTTAPTTEVVTPTATVVASPSTPEPPPQTTPPTATTAPADTLAPAATVAPQTPAATTAAQSEVSEASERVFGLVEELVDELGHREAGTAEELQAAEHLKERLDEMGYSAAIRSFTLEQFDLAYFAQTLGANTQVVIESPMQAQVPGLILTTTPAGGSKSGPLVAVGPGDSEDLPPEGLSGKIALI